MSRPLRFAGARERAARLFVVMAGVAASLVVACGALIGVTDPVFRDDAGGGAGGGGRDDAGDAGDGRPCAPPDSNCGECDPGGGEPCDGGSTTTTLGDIRQILVVGDSIYVAQSDGIYRVPKADLPLDGGAVVATRISTLANAYLSSGAHGGLTLYAVGDENGKRVAASCSVPCKDENSWPIKVSEGTAAVREVIANEDRLFFFRADRLVEVGKELRSIDGGASCQLAPGGVNRVHVGEQDLYWHQNINGNCEVRRWEMDRNLFHSTVGSIPGGPCVDVRYIGQVGDSSRYAAIVTPDHSPVKICDLLPDGDWVDGERFACKNAEVDGEYGDLIAGGPYRILTPIGASGDFFVQSRYKIYICKNADGAGGDAKKCRELSPPSGWRYSTPIVSMAVDGEDVYYANVATSGDGAEVGTITHIPGAAPP